jgi:hypothetical protein
MLKSVRSAERLAAKQTDLLSELDSIKGNLEKIQSMEQDCVKRVGEMDSIKPARAA